MPLVTNMNKLNADSNNQKSPILKDMTTIKHNKKAKADSIITDTETNIKNNTNKPKNKSKSIGKNTASNTSPSSKIKNQITNTLTSSMNKINNVR